MALTSKPLAKVRDTIPLDEVTKGDLVRFNFYIDRVTLKALRAEAFAAEVSVADLVRKAIAARKRK